ncbi:MAG TPA: transcriptional regulator [Armatimonadetes bacterium]|nr:transcriptional regulator [Armatimonadota bacterium]
MDALSSTLHALADPTRRAILSRLAGGDATINDLAAPFDMPLPAVSKHIKVLESAGLVKKRKVAQSRPCTLDPAPLQAVDAWLKEYRQFWEGSLDRLEAYIHELKDQNHE